MVEVRNTSIPHQINPVNPRRPAMLSYRSRKIVLLGFSFAIALLASRCEGHFLWVKAVTVDGQPQGLVFFGESPADETYHFPEKLAKTKLFARGADGKLTEVATKSVDTEERVGLMGPLSEGAPAVLQATQQYGVYGTALLQYHAKHVCGAGSEAFEKAGTSKDLKLEIVPKLKDDEIELTVLWDGKPLADVDVNVLEGKSEAQDFKTGADGKLRFKPKEQGPIGVLANTMEKDKAGELDGKKYKGVWHYASLTFDLSGGREGPKDAKDEANQSHAKSAKPKHTSSEVLPPLPEPVASFGAVVLDGWLYVYGGHTGEEHEHSAANLSQHFRRIQLEGGKEWQELPMQTPVQGFPLVAHDGKVYRVGGLNIRNATTNDEEDLHSTAEFAEFDPATKQWKALASLPAARSSHNAAVIGDKLYVVGGWRLAGKSPGTWEPDALVYDFTKPTAGWQRLPAPEFKRRALGAGVWDGKLVALGGMDEKNKVSMNVDIFDPQTGKWSQGPKLPGAGMAGFGVSAWNLNGDLYECGMRGTLYRLNREGTAWEEAGRVETPRFFHQLVPAPNGGLMVVGGASEEGHLASIERVELTSGAAKDRNAKANSTVDQTSPR